MKIILASGSERRKELLKLITSNFEVLVSNEEEILEEGITIQEQSKRLSYIKAKSVFDKTKGDRIVIGSDTMVIKQNKIYGKPNDKEDAIKMLQELRNTSHEVITGLAVLIQDGAKYKEFITYDITKVYIKDISDSEITNWVENNKVLDKAGAYAIQGEFSVFIDKIEGNYNTVVGLPIHKLYDIIKDYLN